jgi:FtsH-binding integral membrane protein
LLRRYHAKFDEKKSEATMLGTILIVFLILALVGALPRWSHSRNWGYFPTGGLGLVLIIIVVLVLLGRL